MIAAFLSFCDGLSADRTIVWLDSTNEGRPISEYNKYNLVSGNPQCSALEGIYYLRNHYQSKQEEQGNYGDHKIAPEEPESRTAVSTGKLCGSQEDYQSNSSSYANGIRQGYYGHCDSGQC